MSWSKSGRPSPEMADVGTTFTYDRGSGFFQYSATLRPSSFSCRNTWLERCSNSVDTCSFWRLKLSRMGASGTGFQLYSRSTLLSAMMKGVLRMRSMLMLSIVCCSKPCMRSTHSTAMSHKPEPRARRLVKDSWPGVSITSRPGSFMSKLRFPVRSPSVRFSTDSAGMKVAPICCVIPPASPSCTLVRRMLSKIFVLPTSTWPRMQQMGERRASLLAFWRAALARANRRSFAASSRLCRS
mmetsp:Transcript_3196/g.8463  ORF Transcript_3196/g.8463 Transcript_3196/m.8463 type:complete len:240 (+) Transcript_3196:1701-2420(+)